MIHGKTKCGSVCQVRQPQVWLLLRVLGLQQKYRSLYTIFHPLVGSRRGNFTAEHRTLPLYSSLFMSEEPCTEGCSWDKESMLVMLLRNFKVCCLPKQASLKGTWLCLHNFKYLKCRYLFRYASSLG